MRIPLTFSILSLSIFPLLLTSLAHADFTDGVAAYVRGDYEAALKELRPLASQGNTEAQFLVGLMYNNGQGVPQDYGAAARWYRLAAEQGIDDAQFTLGVMYQDGLGVLQDYVQAHMWYNLAAARNQEDATELRDSLAEQMTPAQILTLQESVE